MFFLMFSLKSSFLRTCGAYIVCGLGKILRRKDLDLKYSGIRAYVQVENRSADRRWEPGWESLRAYSQFGPVSFLSKGRSSQFEDLVCGSLWKTTFAQAFEIPTLRERHAKDGAPAVSSRNREKSKAWAARRPS